MKIALKRVYDEPSKKDGYRVLVDRLWPRGVRKEVLKLDEWCKDIAPSPELRSWFHEDPTSRFDEFAERYQAELSQSDIPKELLEHAVGKECITLLYASSDSTHNHASVLRDYLNRQQSL